ncbi:diacylglycerol/lipid kinase family protein [Alkaliphilus hydrothermalis]|uniref:YegS/Rv2252/BmrU family lipid kinase n=1 Tax=Alkaliphilus hydrothermalis TaxID=1482730 RepID=A0ABS2NRJ7_9FIRM|nr:YegS/Rv2252/BmrU family lipid kinase [Alkaliphilus hydrothermalis]
MKKLSYLFIVNPVAGNYKANKVMDVLKIQLEGSNIDYKVAYTTHKGGAADLLNKMNFNPYDVIVAVGGDGTVNEVINSMVGTDKIIGIIPSGTGNDLAKSLNIPPNPVEALDMIINGEVVSIDVGRADDRYFTNVASIGLDAEIAYHANKMKKKLSGTKAYILSLIKVLCTFKSFPIELEHEGEIIKKEVMLVAVCNGKFYGGGMKIAPEASLSDGKLDVCLIEKMPKFKLLFLFPTVYKGTHNRYKEVQFYRTDKFIIRPKSGLLNLDGEVFNQDEELKFSVLNSYIKVALRNQKVEMIENQIDHKKIKAPAS